jgi:hypothetical protein
MYFNIPVFFILIEFLVANVAKFLNCPGIRTELIKDSRNLLPPTFRNVEFFTCHWLAIDKGNAL